jgi:DNA-binding transcriptional LysR family regulator
MDDLNSPSLRHLRVFEMVSELESVRKAADAVHLSQPAVTQAIAKLESQVGAVLFERRSSGTYLSPPGRTFFARTKNMFRQIEDALTLFGISESKGRTVSSIAQRITRSQIRGLAAIAGGRSFADAARRIDVSQASLHRAARELERNVGKPLFYKSLYGIVTTRGGTELARKLSLALREIEWGIEEIHTGAGHRGGQLRVGAPPLAGSFLLALVLNELTQEYPDVHVQVRTGGREHLIKAVQHGEIDFFVGLVSPDIDDVGIEQEALIYSPYVLVARENHPLTRKNKITPADLAAYNWVAPVLGATRRQTFDSLLRQMKGAPRANIETYSLSAIRLLLCGSDRLAMLTKFEVDFEQAPGLVTLPYGPIEPMHCMGLMRRANWQPTTLHNRFMELTRARAAAINREIGLDHAA